MRRKIAIIGNSGSGRSTITKLVGGDLDVAEMDRHFSTSVSPPYAEALDWIISRTGNETVIDISTHLQMLRDMSNAKCQGLDSECFNQILFVYLYNSDPNKRRQFLEQPNARGHLRRNEHVEGSLRHHHDVYDACRDLADITVNTARMSVEEVADMVKGLMRGIGQQS